MIERSPFVIRRLCTAVYAGGFTAWVYEAHPDDLNDILTIPDWFADACDMLRPGDRITITTAIGGAEAFVVSRDPVRLMEIGRAMQWEAMATKGDAT